MFRAATCMLLLAGCLDYRGAYDKCIDAGRCESSGGGTGGAGGMAGGAGGATAGGAGGGTAGGGSYDGGARCSGSVRPRLQCSAPLQLASTGPFENGRLANFSDGLAMAWSRGQTVELHAFAPDGGTRQLFAAPAGAQVGRISLATEGDMWALLVATSDTQPVTCFSSLDDGGTNVGNAAATLSSAVAVSADGGVAVIRSNSMSGNVAWSITRGCPQTMKASRVNTDTHYLSAVHVPGTGEEGFRFTGTGYFNISNGTLGIMRAGSPDGGLDESVAVQNLIAPYGHEALLNGARSHVMVAYEMTEDAIDFSLGVRSLPVDLTSAASQFTPIAGEPYSWSMAPCGAGCMATAFTLYGSPYTAVWFSNDEVVIEPRTGSDAGWDVACSTAVEATTVGVAWLEGRLRFLVVEPSKVSLVSCDVPPL